jgi:phage FluMu protein Com
VRRKAPRSPVGAFGPLRRQLPVLRLGPLGQRPQVKCPKCRVLAVVIDSWEVGAGGDRKLGQELVCMRCLKVLGRVAPAEEVRA